MLSNDELVAVAEVLKDRLHTTEDDELQAAIWQLVEHTAELEIRRAAAIADLGV
jgi:hypothetical protein